MVPSNVNFKIVMEIVTEKQLHSCYDNFLRENIFIVYQVSALHVKVPNVYSTKQCVYIYTCHQRHPIVRFTITRGLADQVMYHS